MSNSKITPTYWGYISSTKDALLVIQGALNKQLPTVPRRPHDRERGSLIKSGNVFVFIEERSGVKRWTDGVSWSPSRILGRFLVYRELDRSAANEKENRKKSKKDAKRKSISSPTASTFSPTHPQNNQSISSTSSLGTPTHAQFGDASSDLPNRSLVGSLVASYAFKDNGLVKKTLSLTITHQNNLSTFSQETPAPSRPITETIHLISYYNTYDVMDHRLSKPSADPRLKDIQLSSELWTAVKDSSLGGKIPVEDESFFYLETQNPNASMSSMLPTNPMSSQVYYARQNHPTAQAPQSLAPAQPQLGQVFPAHIPAQASQPQFNLPPLSQVEYTDQYSNQGFSAQQQQQPQQQQPYFNPLVINQAAQAQPKYNQGQYNSSPTSSASNVTFQQSQYYPPQNAAASYGKGMLPNINSSSSSSNNTMKPEHSPLPTNNPGVNKYYPQQQQQQQQGNYVKPEAKNGNYAAMKQYYPQSGNPLTTNSYPGGSQGTPIELQANQQPQFSGNNRWFPNSGQHQGLLEDGSPFLNQGYSNGLYQAN